MKPTFSGLTPDACFLPHHLPVDRWGYPVASNGKGGKSKAHRLAYRLFCGPLPQGSMVLHTCGHAQCINPHHLYLGDAAQNAADRDRHGTTARGARLPQTRLSDADVLAIRASGESVTALARLFNTSRGNISSIRVMQRRTGAQPCNKKARG